jgi:hypothetical protein
MAIFTYTTEYGEKVPRLPLLISTVTGLIVAGILIAMSVSGHFDAVGPFLVWLLRMSLIATFLTSVVAFFYYLVKRNVPVAIVWLVIAIVSFVLFFVTAIFG